VDLTPEQEFNVVTLRTTRMVDLGHRHEAMSAGSSACGVCGKDSIEAALETVRGTSWDGPPPGPDVVRRLPALLREKQSVFAHTGGVHAAGLFSADGERHVVREDVGRHNAVDKVTGARLLAGEPVADAYLVVSGRAGFELVQKAVAAGSGSLVAVGAPTRPSWNAQPAASSKSLPGVRMVTQARCGSAPGHASRISSGSSATTWSSRSRAPPGDHSMTRSREVWPIRRTRSVTCPA
jgi:FdhD protein